MDGDFIKRLQRINDEGGGQNVSGQGYLKEGNHGRMLPKSFRTLSHNSIVQPKGCQVNA